MTDLTVRFGSTTVISGLSFSIARGTTTALIGPSGSGKSTLLAVIGGLLRPSSGQVVYDEPRAPSIAWVFQTTNILSRRTALANVSIGAVARTGDYSTARDIGWRCLDQLGIAHLASRRAGSLSGGERQRVAIARALAGEPSLLLADEPTAQLDRHNAGIVADALISGRTDNTAVVVATHDQLVAARCDHTVHLVPQSE